MCATDAQSSRLFEAIFANRWNAAILERMVEGRAAEPVLRDWWLTAGCIAQSVWNLRHGFAPDRGIVDYDIFYHDPDTSWQAEDAVIRTTEALFSDLPVAVQVRNQARVPLWYADKFGVSYPPVGAASDGIDRFPCKSTAIGIRTDGAGYQVYAPFGIDYLLQGVLAPNPVLPIPAVYAAKVTRWRSVWPELVVHPWPAEEI